MSVETERKYLVCDSSWRITGNGIRYQQGYLCTDKQRSVRVRIGGEAAFVTIKGPTEGASRLEFEFPIPVEEAKDIIELLCVKPVIDKTRYRIEYAGMLWEVDEFHGENTGLVVAEIELESEEQSLELPGWVGREVTGDPRYYNVSLVTHPYREWSDRA